MYNNVPSYFYLSYACLKCGWLVYGIGTFSSYELETKKKYMYVHFRTILKSTLQTVDRA